MQACPAHPARAPVATALLGALGTAIAVMASHPVRADGWTPARAPLPRAAADEIEVQEVRLSDLRAEPSRWLGQHVRFVLQMRGVVEEWNPYLSRFSPEDWAGFGGWPDESFTWDPDVFDDPAPRLFVRAGTPLADLVAGAPAYARYTVTGVLREILLDEPWIEVDAMQRLPQEVGSGTLLHVDRALELMERGEWELALEQLERARQGPLPEHARRELLDLGERCRKARDEVEALRRRLG